MQFDVTYKFEDYREAYNSTLGTSTLRGMFAWLAVVYLMISFGNFFQPSPPGTPMPIGQALIALTSALAIPTSILLLIVIYWRSLRRLKKPGPTGWMFGISGWIIAIILFAIILALLLHVDDSAQRHKIVVGLIPLFAILAMIQILSFWYTRTHVRRLWDGQENLHGTQRFDFDANGIRVSSATIHSNYNWTAFVRWRESPNLFLLHISKLSYIMLPKRTLGADQVAIDAFRALLQENIQPATGGFPVIKPTLVS